MQRGPKRGARPAAPGIFETIALAMSLLLVQPALILFPIIVDLYLWFGARLSPESVARPLGRWVLRQDATEAADIAETLDRLARTGDLAAILGLAVPSLLAFTDRAEVAFLWERPDVDPGSAALTVGMAGVLVLAGIWTTMLFRVLLARVVRGRALFKDQLLRDVTKAAIRYLGFLALVLAAILLVLVPAGMLAAVLGVLGLNLAPLLVMLVLVPALAATLALAFVAEAIAIAEVGPLRAMTLSFGVAWRSLWPTIGLLLVVLIVSATVPRLVSDLTGSALGVALAIVVYGFIATGLALARMQFFYDRLRRWRAEVIPPVMPAK